MVEDWIRDRTPDLVFLHGWTMDGSIFGDLIARLPDHACFAPTLPGHGPEALAGPATLDGAATAVGDYLSERGIDRPVLIGWSLGAMVAWRMLDLLPDLELAGLVVIDMSPKIVNDPGWSLGIRGFEARHNRNALAAMRADWAAYAKRVNSGMYARGDKGPHADTLAGILRRDPVAMASMWASLADADERGIVKAKPIPTLVIKGAKSRIYPAETGRWIAENAPDALLIRFENSGHSPHLEEPGRFAEVLTDWLAGLA